MSNSLTLTAISSVLNLITLIGDLTGVVICLILLFLTMYRVIRLKCDKGRVSIQVPIILFLDTLCIITMKSITQLFTVTLPTFRRDFQQINKHTDSLLCHIGNYILWSLVGAIYWSYTLQAIFCFARVVHPTRVWLHRSTIYLYVFIPAKFIFVFAGHLPLLLIFDAIHLLSNEAYCDLSMKNYAARANMSIVIFFLPMNIIFISYIWIVLRMRHSSRARPYQERDRRDYIVIRRIVVNIVVLSIVTLPFDIIFTIETIRGYYDSLAYRIQWLGSSVGSILFSITLPWINASLRDLLLKSNEIAPVPNRI